MSKSPEPSDIMAVASVAGVPIDAETSARIVRFIGPALESFSPVSDVLSFDLEPAGFVAVQLRTQQR